MAVWYFQSFPQLSYNCRIHSIKTFGMTVWQLSEQYNITWLIAKLLQFRLKLNLQMILCFTNCPINSHLIVYIYTRQLPMFYTYVLDLVTVDSKKKEMYMCT